MDFSGKSCFLWKLHGAHGLAPLFWYWQILYRKMIYKLVVEPTHLKNMLVKMEIFPKIGVNKHIKYLSCHQPVIFIFDGISAGERSGRKDDRVNEFKFNTSTLRMASGGNVCASSGPTSEMMFICPGEKN